VSTLGLGIDAGGTRTRWALADGAGAVVAEGEVAGFSALQMRTGGRERVAEALAALASEALRAGRPSRVHAGLTGLGHGADELRELIAAPLGLAPGAVTLGTDVETAYLDRFAPGEGYLVYAGTGSIAAYVDSGGVMHRAGGRGAALDDGGGGYWIAREALRHVWRTEDERPGAWRESPMARALFEAVGGDDWAHTREYVYGGDRGAVGLLALAVARSAHEDPKALEILAEAGVELARLARALAGRFGPKPVSLAGRVSELHPVIAESMRAGLPPGTAFAVSASRGHHAAARIAARAAASASPR